MTTEIKNSETLTETEAAAKADIFEILSHAPGEVRGVRQALREGRIEGWLYTGDCACLIGTIAKLRDCHFATMSDIYYIGGRTAERWFTDIRPSHTPENNERARITDEWLSEWLETHGENNGNSNTHVC